MSENEEQTVVDETKGQSETGTEGTDARKDDEDDLDTLLAQYEKEATSDDTSSKPGQSGEAQDPNRELMERLQALEESTARSETRADLDAAIKAVRGELDSEVFDDGFMETYLDSEARKDPRLSQAWANRHNNPKQFQKVVGSLAKSFEKRFGSLPNKEATEDREAVAAAVRGASTKSPEGRAPDYGNLSNDDFAAQVEKDHGFRPI